MERCPYLRRSSGGAGWRSLALSRVEHWKQPAALAAAASAPIQAKSPCGPCPSCSVDPQEGRGGNSWGEWPAVSDKGNLHTKLHLRKMREQLWASKQAVRCRQPGQFSVANTSQSLHEPPSALVLPWLQRKGPSVGTEENTHIKGTEPACAQPPGLLLQQLGSRSHTWQRPLSRGKVPAQTCLPPSPVTPCTKAVTASTPRGKMHFASMSNPAFPPNALGTHNLYNDAPM